MFYFEKKKNKLRGKPSTAIPDQLLQRSWITIIWKQKEEKTTKQHELKKYNSYSNIKNHF